MFAARVEEGGPTGLRISLLSPKGRAGRSGSCILDDLRLPSLGRDEDFFRIDRIPWVDGSDDFWVVELVCLSLLTLVVAEGCLQRTSCKIFATLCGKTLQSQCG